MKTRCPMWEDTPEGSWRNLSLFTGQEFQYSPHCLPRRRIAGGRQRHCVRERNRDTAWEKETETQRERAKQRQSVREGNRDTTWERSRDTAWEKETETQNGREKQRHIVRGRQRSRYTKRDTQIQCLWDSDTAWDGERQIFSVRRINKTTEWESQQKEWNAQRDRDRMWE
jgi:hypothetical protein